jgi:hypothetical protein
LTSGCGILNAAEPRTHCATDSDTEQTFDRLEGYIADSNGTRLDMYDGEQVVQVHFLSNTSMVSSWVIAGRVNEVYFAIDIPERFRDAEVVRIYVSRHMYTVDDGTRTTPRRRCT